jgi:hypothetical protein
VTDSGGNAVTATLTITISPVNDAPIVRSESLRLAANDMIAVDVLANDSDPDGDSMTASLVSGPSSGTLDFNSDGSFVYTPSASFFGSISFTYQVSAGGQTDTATVTIIVT